MYKLQNLVLAKGVLIKNRRKMYLQIIVTLRYTYAWSVSSTYAYSRIQSVDIIIVKDLLWIC